MIDKFNNKNIETTQASNCESLSALMDGELDDLTLHRLLKLSTQEWDEAKSWWDEANKAHHILQGKSSAVSADADFLQGIHDKISEVKQVKKSFSWARPLTYTAIAASMMVVTLVGIQFFNYSGTVPTQISSTSKQVIDQTATVAVMPSSQSVLQPVQFSLSNSENNVLNMQKESLSKKVESDRINVINQMIHLHAENILMNDRRGLLPFVKVGQFE